jgi:hypothetical protein
VLVIGNKKGGRTGFEMIISKVSKKLSKMIITIKPVSAVKEYYYNSVHKSCQKSGNYFRRFLCLMRAKKKDVPRGVFSWL